MEAVIDYGFTITSMPTVVSDPVQWNQLQGSTSKLTAWLQMPSLYRSLALITPAVRSWCNQLCMGIMLSESTLIVMKASGNYYTINKNKIFLGTNMATQWNGAWSIWLCCVVTIAAYLSIKSKEFEVGRHVVIYPTRCFSQAVAVYTLTFDWFRHHMCLSFSLVDFNLVYMASINNLFASKNHRNGSNPRKD